MAKKLLSEINVFGRVMRKYLCSTEELAGRRCPRCGSVMLTNGLVNWCSFVECDYGLDGSDKVDDAKEADGPEAIA